MLIFSPAWWLHTILIGSYESSPLELFGVLSGLGCVYLTVRQNIWCWPIGIVSALAFAWLFVVFKLYADVYLQIFFVLTSFNGWYWWLRGGANHSTLHVSTLQTRQLWLVGATTLLVIITVGTFHANYTDASLPYLDAIASGGSVTAQLLMLRKKIECWPMWIVIDTLSVGIYLYKSLYFTAVLYLLFLGLATMGFISWRREWNAQTPDELPTQSLPA